MIKRADTAARVTAMWLCCGFLVSCVPAERAAEADTTPARQRACAAQPGEPGLQATLDSIQELIFGPRCASCHGGVLPSMGMALDTADNSYANLVGARALESPTLFRVSPMDAEASYLVHKLEDRQLLGESMPLGSPPLTDDEIAIIRDWIDAGAVRVGNDAEPPPCADPPAGQPLQARLSSIQAHIFSPHCARCHGGEDPAQGLRLDSPENSHAGLVGVPSRQVPALMRVQPHQPDESYLVHKIEGRQASGGRMPLGAEALSAEQIAAIRQWISDGAAND